jgi:DNA-binding CsgD family transcriptional regulator
MGTLPAVRARKVIDDLAVAGHGWVEYVAEVVGAIESALPHYAFCFHTVDPGTVLFTGSVNRNVGCSGSWLAHHEYVVEDVNKWSFLAQSGRLAGATSLATHGDLSRSERHRSHATHGFGDELRVSFVDDGMYWGAAGFLRAAGDRPFTERDVEVARSLATAIAAGHRRALTVVPVMTSPPVEHGPGVVVFDAAGTPESVSPAAERWIAELDEHPAPDPLAESRIIQAVAARARSIPPGSDPLELSARARVRTCRGRWLLLYGTRLAGGAEGRTAVVIHPAAPQDVAPVIALSYGLTERECEVAMQCVQGRATKEIARELGLSPYTVQDHLKSIFAKTGVRSRGELVGRVFLDHYAPRWDTLGRTPPGLAVHTIEP